MKIAVCDSCNKTQDNVDYLICLNEKKEIFICNECVVTCVTILEGRKNKCEITTKIIQD